MTQDAFASQAQIRILLVPIQPLQRQKYEQYCKLITDFDRVPLRDVPPDSRGQVAPLSAHAQSNGTLLLSYTHSYDRTHSYLEGIQPSRRILGVIGILDASEWTSDLNEAYVEYERLLGQLHFSPLATRCYAFDPLETQNDRAEGIVIVPDVGDTSFYIGTLLADFCASILHELSNAFFLLDQKIYVPSPYASQAADETFATADDINAIKRPRSTQPINESVESVAHRSMSDLRRTSVLSTTSLSMGASDRPQSSIDLGQTDKTVKKKMQGRISKTKGDYRALAGRWDEALHDYAEAALTARLTGDDLWHAAALEATYKLECIHAWYRSHKEVPHGPYSNPRVDVVAMASQTSLDQNLNDFNTIRDMTRMYICISTYSRTLYTNMADESTRPVDATPPIMYAEACLCLCRVLVSVWTHGGWNAAALEAIVTSSRAHSKATPLQKPMQDAAVTRYAINEAASLASNASYHILTVVERVSILSRLASVYHSIGFARKEAAILWELAALVADSSRTARRAELQAKDHSGHVVKSSPQFAGNDTVALMFEKACRAARINLVETATFDRIGASSQSIVQTYQDDLAKEDHQGWPSLQIALLSDAVMGAQYLTAYQTALRFAVTLLHSLSDFMRADIQASVKKNIVDIFSAANRRGAEFQLGFWGPPNFIVGFELESVESSRALHLSSTSNLSERSESETNDKGKQPFIFDPKTLESQATKVVLAQGDSLTVLATIQNPFAFDLEIPRILISASGAAFTPLVSSILVPANSLQTVKLSGVTNGTGILYLRGVKVALSNTVEQEFLLPTTEPGQQDDNPSGDPGKAEKSSDAGDRSAVTTTEPTFAQCLVTESQPLLRLSATSLEQGSMMIFEGERKILKLVLENISNCNSEYMQVTFQDNHSSACAATLMDTEIDLAPDEAYELDFELQKRPVFSWERVSELVLPGHKLSLNIHCLGKYGCTDGVIQIEYGRSAASHHVRKMIIPVQMTCRRLVTVASARFIDLPATTQNLAQHSPAISNAMLSPTIEFPSTHISRRKSSFADIPQTVREDIVSSANAQIGVVLKVASECSHALTIHLERRGFDGPALAIQHRLEARATANLLLPFSLVNLQQSIDFTQDIPGPTIGRQFVVSAKRKSMTAKQKRRETEHFWTRQALLRSIHVSWKSSVSRRSGEASLREIFQSFTPKDEARRLRVDITSDIWLDENKLQSDNGKIPCEQASFLDFCGKARRADREPLTFVLACLCQTRY